MTRREDSLLYQHRHASVLVKNNEAWRGVPRVHGRAILDTLEVSAREGVPVQVISGYRANSENHRIYGGIDVYIEGYSTEETAEALCSSGRFNRVSSYSGGGRVYKPRTTAHADYREDVRQGLFDDWIPLRRSCR